MRVYIETLGCAKNTVDSEHLAALLEQGGNAIVDDPEEADAMIVNTCGFIRAAKEESIDTILSLAERKQEHPDALLIVSGCLSQRYTDELFEEIPEADIILGVNDYGNINEILRNHRKKQRTSFGAGAPAAYDEFPDRKTGAGAYSAFLKISEGCDNACTYCVIPSIRGGFRSRRKEDILQEAETLAARGVRELVVIAQDVTAYGKDLYGGYVLHELLTELCRIDGIHWIRLLYCYDDSITDELIEVMAREPKICSYIDIPLQHINDGILSDMNRNATKDGILQVIRRLRERVPDIHIRTTFITGFPGETEAQFEELEEFVRTERFERMGVFAYSQEENTIAGERTDQIPEEIREERRDRLMQLQQKISLELNQKKIGQVLEVLVEEQEEDGTWLGRTAFDAPEIDNGVIFVTDQERKPGDFVRVRILDAFDYDLTGEEVTAYESAE